MVLAVNFGELYEKIIVVNVLKDLANGGPFIDGIGFTVFARMVDIDTVQTFHDLTTIEVKNSVAVVITNDPHCTSLNKGFILAFVKPDRMRIWVLSGMHDCCSLRVHRVF